MKKRLLITLLLMITSFLFIGNVNALSYGRVTSASTILRTGPGTNYSKGSTLKYNDVVHMISNIAVKSTGGCSAGWYKINDNGATRYICKSDVYISNITVRVSSKTLDIKNSITSKTAYKTVGKNTILTLVDNSKTKNSNCSSGWYKIFYDGKTRYVCSGNTKYYTSASKVIVINKSGTNIREKALGSSKLIIKLKYGQALSLYRTAKVYGSGCKAGWYRVNYKGAERYVCSSNVFRNNNVYRVNSLNGIEVKTSASSSSSRLTSLAYMNSVILNGTTKYKGAGCNAGWYKILVNKSRTGYVCSSLVSSSNISTAISDNEEVNIRKEASSSSSKVTSLTNGKALLLQNATKVNGAGCNAGWYKLSLNGGTAYVCSSYTELGKAPAATTSTTTTTSGSKITSHKTSSGSYYTINKWSYRVKENYAYVRGSASTSGTLKDIVYLGTEMDVTGTKAATSGCSAGWYKVKYYGGKVGYICKSLVDKYSDVTRNNSSYCNTLKNAGFPASYCPYLSYLHEKHPNWVFKAEKTGLTFLAAVNGESERNYTQATANGYIASSTIREAGGWRTASDAYVAYMLDPRNYLNDQNIFAFENLSYDSKYHTINVVKSIFSGTYLANNSYPQYFIDAGSMYNVSPVHLASRVKQEGGTNSSYAAVSGTVSGTCSRSAYICSTYVDKSTKKIVNASYVKMRDGAGTNYDIVTRAKKGESFKFVNTKLYKSEKGCSAGWYKINLTRSLKGIYNYYNIGAYNDNPVMRGLKAAAGCVDYNENTPWDSREKAIKYGASFIAGGYISVGQDTMYYQKFNTGPNTRTPKYTHQYMTNILAPASESLSTYDSYSSLNLINKAYVFKIPVYNSMPTDMTTHPPVK